LLFQVVVLLPLIAPFAIITPAARMPEATVSAVAARDAARGAEFAAKHMIPRVFDSYDKLISDPDIDAVFIPLPNSLHCEWAIKALDAGKHVLCEKPMASNADEAERMSVAADKNDRVLMEAFHWRYHPVAGRLLEILTSGELGTIQNVELVGYLPWIIFSSDNIRFNYNLAGGALMDFGCYAVNLIRFIMKEEPVVTQAHATLYKPQIDESMQASFAFPSGGTASIDCSLRAWRFKTSVVVTGDKGRLELSGFPLFSMFHSITVTNKESRKSRTEKCYGDNESTYWYQLKAFVQTVRGNKNACISTKEDAILNMKVIDAIYEKAGLVKRGTII